MTNSLDPNKALASLKRHAKKVSDEAFLQDLRTATYPREPMVDLLLRRKGALVNLAEEWRRSSKYTLWLDVPFKDRSQKTLQEAHQEISEAIQATLGKAAFESTDVELLPGKIDRYSHQFSIFGKLVVYVCRAEDMTEVKVDVLSKIVDLEGIYIFVLAKDHTDTNKIHWLQEEILNRPGIDLLAFDSYDDIVDGLREKMNEMSKIDPDILR